MATTQYDTERFLTALYGTLESGNIYLWTLPDHRTWPFSVNDMSMMIACAQAIQDDRDVYFGLGGSMEPIPDNKRVMPNSVSFIPGLWMDIDLLGPAHKQTDLPKTVEEALSILPDFLTPSITVSSGHGLHMYWLFKECWVFESQDENQRASNLMINLQAYIKSLAAQRGWKFDSTADLSRVLRVPGTLNHKLGTHEPVTITSFTDLRYDPSELEDVIPETDFRAEITNHGKFERRPTDASSELMIANCAFLQHCLHNAQTITYGEWLSMLTNVVRGTDGIEKSHQLSQQDQGRYTPKGTDFKLTEALKMNPHTCDYIRTTHGFNCPSGGCGVKSPCSFSLSRVDQARARVNMIGIPNAEKIFTPEMIESLSIVKRNDATLYAKTRDKLKGNINLRDLDAAIKQFNQSQNANLEIMDVPPDATAQKTLDLPAAQLPAGSEDIKFPTTFRITNTGIYYVKISDNGPILTRACGCLAYISARLYNQDTDSESLKIAYKYMGHWRDIVVPRSMAVDSRSVIKLADRGLAVSSDGAKYLAKYFDEFLFVNQEHIPIQTAVSSLGWRDHQFIFPSLNPEIEIDIDDLGSRHALKGLSMKGKLSEWVNVAQRVRNTSPSARFILSTGFTAPLLRLLSQRNFIVHNHGGSQGGKTATLWLSMSIWGEPHKIIYSFDNTNTSLERRASLFSDLPFGINEREVLSAAKKQDISPMLYMLAEGKGKGRGGKVGLQELNTWRTIVLSTGEGPLTNTSSMDGLMTRTIELEGGPLASDVDLAKYLYSFLPYCHGHAGIVFLQNLLQSDHSMIVDFYREAQQWLRTYYLDRIDSHLDALASVMTADYLSSCWVFGTAPETAKSETYTMATDIAGRLIRKVDASESERAWGEFQDWVGENSDRLGNGFSSTKIGVKDDFGNIYIIRRAVNEFLSKYSSADKIIREWGENGKIKSRDDGQKKRFDMPKRISGVLVRCISFREDKEE